MLIGSEKQKGIIEQPPYVVSSDLAEIFAEWGDVCGISIPTSAYFSDRVSDIVRILGSVFDDVRIVDDASITRLFRDVSEQTTLPILSIDKIYMSNVLGKGFSGYLSITRAVDADMKPVGLISRPVSWDADNISLDSIENAVSRIAQGYHQQNVTLVDDVVFSGGTISRIVEILQEHDIVVHSVVAGVSIGQAKEVLAARGIPLRSAYHFPDVIDEICCRDFIIGSPYGGRAVVTKPRTDGTKVSIQYAPYIRPLGDVAKWATIPENQARDFSICMMDIACKIWEDIQDLNHRIFSTKDLGCRVYGLPERPSVIEAIQEIRKTL